MTRQEYKEYENTVASFLERENIAYPSTDSEECRWFSWEPCECCGGPAGARTTLHAVSLEDGNFYDYQVCPNCEYYFTYGRLDDMTMMSLEDVA